MHMKRHIHILDLEPSLESQALRTAMEYWGAQVSITYVGNSTDIVDSLREIAADLTVITGHGDEKGFVLPELDETLHKDELLLGRMGKNQILEPIQVKCPVLLSLACKTGIEDIAKAFLSSGAKTYVGPKGYMEANDVLMFALKFLYEYITSDSAIEKIHSDSQNICTEGRLMQLWS